MENDDIIFEIDIDYDLYRRKLLSEIILELDVIFDIFNDKNNNILIKLLIINKKIVKEEEKYILNIFVDLIKSLKKVEENLLDQKEYLDIILKLLNVYSFINYINIFLLDLFLLNDIKLNFSILLDDLKKLFEKIKSNNKLFDLLCKLINEENNNDVYLKETEEIVLNISAMLVKDYFVYYNSFDMLQILHDNTMINNKSILSNILNKYNNNFQDVYIYGHEKYSQVYNNEKDKIAKCKYIIKNDKFNDLIEEFLNIDHI